MDMAKCRLAVNAIRQVTHLYTYTCAFHITGNLKAIGSTYSHHVYVWYLTYIARLPPLHM